MNAFITDPMFGINDTFSPCFLCNPFENAIQQMEMNFPADPFADTFSSCNIMPHTGGYMFSNPFQTPGMPDIETAHGIGLLSDEQVAFLDKIHPIHNTPSEVSFGSSYESPNEWKLNQSDDYEKERDAAVEKYKDAKKYGDTAEMLKWETVANDYQDKLYTLWDTPRYTPSAKAPGID